MYSYACYVCACQSNVISGLLDIHVLHITIIKLLYDIRILDILENCYPR